MKKINKIMFLVLGLSAGMSAVASPMDIVNKVKVSGYLSEYVKPIVDNAGQDFSNYAFMNAQQVCEVHVSHLDKDVPSISDDKPLDLVVKPQNERQKDFLKSLLIIHEQMHCKAMEQEFLVLGKDQKHTEELRYVLNHAVTFEGAPHVVTSLVTENFADIGAVASLIKTYGVEDKDLNFAIHSLLVQRETRYIKKSSFEGISHSTHVGIKTLLESENLKQLMSLNKEEDFNQFILELANSASRKILKSTGHQLDSTLLVESAARNILWQLQDKSEKSHSYVFIKDTQPKGFSYQWAQSAISSEKLKHKDFSADNFSMDKLLSVLNKTKMTQAQTQKFESVLNNFTYLYQSENIDSVVSNRVSFNDKKVLINELRDKFKTESLKISLK